MTKNLSGLALLLGAGFVLTGCPNPNTYGTPRTTPKGKVAHTIAAEGIGASAEDAETGASSSVVLPNLPTYQVRIGVSEEVDIGARLANMSSPGIDVKWNFVKSKVVDLAVDPGAQFFYLTVNDESATVVYGHLPVLLGLNVAEPVSFVLSPGLTYSVASASVGNEDDVSASTTQDGLWARGGVGINFRISDGFALHPEYTLLYNVTSDDKALFYTFGLGFNFGALPSFADGNEHFHYTPERKAAWARPPTDGTARKRRDSSSRSARSFRSPERSSHHAAEAARSGGTMDSEAWRNHFENNRERGSARIDSVDTRGLSPALTAALVHSLRRFQLGEAAGGRLAREIWHLRDPALDDPTRRAIELYVREEGRHAGELLSVLHALGAAPLGRHWSTAWFSRCRRLLGLRTKLLTMGVAEVMGVVFYGMVRDRVPCPEITRVMAIIAEDERRHLDFLTEWFARAIESVPTPARVAYTAWIAGQFSLVLTGAALAVVIDHRELLRLCKVDARIFAASCIEELMRRRHVFQNLSYNHQLA